MSTMLSTTPSDVSVASAVETAVGSTRMDIGVKSRGDLETFETDLTSGIYHTDLVNLKEDSRMHHLVPIVVAGGRLTHLTNFSYCEDATKRNCAFPLRHPRTDFQDRTRSPLCMQGKAF